MDDRNHFGMAFFKYLHKNEIFLDDWDPLLVRNLTKKLMETGDKLPLIHMLLGKHFFNSPNF